MQVPRRLRGFLGQQGIVLPDKVSSLEIHRLKRVYEEQQWPSDTTNQRYVEDLHRAVVHPDVQVWTYHYFEQPFAGLLAPSDVQDAPKPERYIFVVYSPVYGTITTGYQASNRDEIFMENHTGLIQHR